MALISDVIQAHRTSDPQSSSSLLEAINAAIGSNDAATALRLCEAQLAIMPDDPDLQRYVGQIYAVQGNFDAARTAARRATELAPNDPRTWSDLGRVWLLSRDWQAAVRCFRQAVSLKADLCRRLAQFGGGAQTPRRAGRGLGLSATCPRDRPDTSRDVPRDGRPVARRRSTGRSPVVLRAGRRV